MTATAAAMSDLAPDVLRQRLPSDAFVPLVDSGIAAYVWSGRRFVSLVPCSCRRFDGAAAIACTRNAMQVDDEVVIHAF